MDLSFTNAAVLGSAVIFGSESHRTHHILPSQIRDSHNLEGQVPIFTYIPQGQGGPTELKVPVI
jgi:hypothetical protein